MLLGEYAHMLDDKGRLTLPAALRPAFASGAVVTGGLDGCLYIYPLAEWEQFVQRILSAVEPLSQDGRRLQRHFFAAAAVDDLDKQGRIRLPAVLLERAKLSKFVVVAGVNDRIEVWDDRAWQSHVSEIEGSASDRSSAKPAM